MATVQELDYTPNHPMSCNDRNILFCSHICGHLMTFNMNMHFPYTCREITVGNHDGVRKPCIENSYSLQIERGNCGYAKIQSKNRMHYKEPCIPNRAQKLYVCRHTMHFLVGIVEHSETVPVPNSKPPVKDGRPMPHKCASMGHMPSDNHPAPPPPPPALQGYTHVQSKHCHRVPGDYIVGART